MPTHQYQNILLAWALHLEQVVVDFDYGTHVISSKSELRPFLLEIYDESVQVINGDPVLMTDNDNYQSVALLQATNEIQSCATGIALVQHYFICVTKTFIGRIYGGYYYDEDVFYLPELALLDMNFINSL